MRRTVEPAKWLIERHGAAARRGRAEDKHYLDQELHWRSMSSANWRRKKTTAGHLSAPRGQSFYFLGSYWMTSVPLGEVSWKTMDCGVAAPTSSMVASMSGLNAACRRKRSALPGSAHKNAKPSDETAAPGATDSMRCGAATATAGAAVGTGGRTCLASTAAFDAPPAHGLEP